MTSSSFSSSLEVTCRPKEKVRIHEWRENSYSQSRRKGDHLRHSMQFVVICIAISCCQPVACGTETFYLSLPNTDTAFERVLGVGLAFPHPYYQRPKLNFPKYDINGRGTLKYGHGGNEAYPYTVFDPVEGHHR